MHDIKDVCESQFPNKWKMNERSEFEKCTRVVGWRHRQSPWSSLMQIWQMTWNCYIQVDAWVVVSYYEELSKVWMLVAPHSSRYWNRLLCSPSSRPGGRELSCRLGNYFGLRKLGSRQQLREIDIGQIPYLVIMVVSFWVLSPSQFCKKFATWFSNGNISFILQYLSHTIYLNIHQDYSTFFDQKKWPTADCRSQFNPSFAKNVTKCHTVARPLKTRLVTL